MRTERSYLLLLVTLATLLPGCGFPVWRDQVMSDLMADRLRMDYSRIGAGGSGSETIEFYDAGGRHTGYGVIRGGSIDLYHADGSRAGYGRAWR